MIQRKSLFLLAREKLVTFQEVVIPKKIGKKEIIFKMKKTQIYIQMMIIQNKKKWLKKCKILPKKTT
jgi:hypothetical protein